MNNLCPTFDDLSPELQKRYPNLFNPLTILDLTIRNRVFISSHASMLAEDYAPGDRLIAYLEKKAVRGVGLIITESANAHPSSSENVNELCIWEPSFAQGLERLRERLDRYETKLFVQLYHGGGGGTHAGTMEKCANVTVSNDDMLVEGIPGRAHILTENDVWDLIAGFAESAGVCKRHGAHGIEITAAHGFLLHRFLSPLNNRRDDHFGGDFDRRLNLLREMFRAIRKEVGPSFPVGVRIGCNDFLKESLSHADMMRICKTLDQEHLVDFFDMTGSHEFVQRSLVNHYGMMDDKAGHLVEEVGQIKNTLSVPMLHAARIINPRQAEDILASSAVDMVGMTRAHIADPELIRKTVEDRELDILYCVGCSQSCVGRVVHDRHVTCIQNPNTGREFVWANLPNPPKEKRIAVVGGGPAGMAFAWTSGQRGHQVTLFDANHELGGQVLLAEQLPLSKEMGTVARNLSRQVTEAGVEVRLNTRVTVDDIKNGSFDEVIVATGSRPYLPTDVAGMPSAKVFTLEDAVRNPKKLGDRVILIDNDGHQRGASMAAWLIDIGKQLRIVTEFSHLGCHFEFQMLKIRLYQQIYKNKTPVYPNYRWVEITDKSLHFEDQFASTPFTIDAFDSVVVLYPPQAHSSLGEALTEAGIAAHLIGDCLSPRNIEQATFEGVKLARAL